MRKIIMLCFTFLVFGKAMAQEIPLLSNISSRNNITLNGKWSYIVDPLENGYYDYRLLPFKNNGFFENKKWNTTDLTEYNFATSATMDIPSDWNSKDERLFFYEGTVWFQKDFNYKKSSQTKGILHFGAVNYDAKVYVNGKLAGSHVGGYTPFNFDVTNLLIDGNNFVVVKVDNKRHKDNVPTVNMDWWNYGGITRDVTLAQVPNTYIEDYLVQLDKKDKTKISGWVKLNSETANQSVSISIPELKITKNVTTDAKGMAYFEIKSKPVLWTPENPKLYEVAINKADENITDKIGFRTIETKGKEILLNGKKVFLRGISIHEEAPFRSGRAWSTEDAVTLLTWAKELGCNYVRLAHYPHNENMVKEAEKMGLMIWSEVPVYWTISWTNPDTYANAERQLHDMIYRDKNRCGIVIWSIANETPHGDDRDVFLSKLAKYARTQDNSRLISMAMEVTKSPNNVNTLHDNMNEYVDIVSFNQYLGWYRGTNESCKDMQWVIPYNKPVIISEFGGEALQGLHGDKKERWNEEYQEELYVQNTQMFNRIEGLAGVSPWILVDFRSPRRQLPNIQDFFNRKGLISDQGIKKKAFYVMKDWYAQKEKEYK
ncbi:glycoside hydrolase family 2 protein [Flavobacterium johnsoniae]|uniref:Beta-glucuronidase n=1 Tax=Flavobacterium johnsoniae TaxID=986 RepID=A0A1J7BR61_FLAJO|nr:glycoside hydrolase family 2 TIM barrel-domain containing protein [Flavobacterium johnsoniae]OIV41187.1 beta-glucuronidase [Flavobacterium johnsoniae]OIV42250.1 beta-glucuronidase [Flavobacterium johnsoniae]